MKINLGDFGGRVAPATPDGRKVSTESAFVTPIAEKVGAGESIMRGAQGLLTAERQQQAELEKQRATDEAQAKRNKAAASFAQYRVDVETLSTDIGTRLTEGQVKREDARKELDKGLADLKKRHLEPLDPGSRDALADNLILFDGHANLKFDGALRELAKKERVDGFTNTIESLQRLALTDREGAVRQAEVLFKGEGVALMGADKAGKALQKFREDVTFTDIDRRITANQTNAKGLQDLKAELGSDKYADLAPERRNFLEAKIQRNELHLQQQGEIAERRRLHALEMQSKRFSWYVENGREIPPGEFNAFVKAAKGTPFEGMADAIIGEQRLMSELSGLTPDRMVAKVRELEEKYGPTPSKEQISHIEKVKRFTDRSIKLLNESPLTYATEREGAVLEPLDMANPASWASNLQNRTAILTEQTKRTGAAPKGLFPQEVHQLTSMLRSSPASQKREILASLRQGFGDDRVFKATMQQIAPDDPVTAAAGIAAARGLTSTKDRYLADELLRGQELLRPNRKEDGKPGSGSIVKMPADKDLMLVFANRSRDAFANNSEAGDLFFQQVKAIYAARTDAAGDMSGVVNSTRLEEAIAAVAPFEKHRGRQIVMPHGMSYGQFRDGLQRRVDDLVASGRLDDGWNAGKLMDLPLQNSGDGKYIFRIGDGKLVDKGRRPVVIDFNEALPFRTSGEGMKPDPEAPSPAELEAAAAPARAKVRPKGGQ